MDELSKQYTTFTIGYLYFYKCNHMPFGLCNMPSTYQRLMQNCLGDLNLTYCLISFEDIIFFLWTAKEHLHHLCIVFDLESIIWNWSHPNVTFSEMKSPPQKLKPRSNCRMHPTTKLTWRCTLSLVWWATAGGSSKGLHKLSSPLVSISPERGPVRSKSRCHLQRMPWRLSKCWN